MNALKHPHRFAPSSVVFQRLSNFSLLGAIVLAISKPRNTAISLSEISCIFKRFYLTNSGDLT
ncbi:hypothetical protein PHMEG_0004021 [Phytophthora megakarya]|uniref:Uncharacterized protein n=1 Tax=Phytophthora megakarya TaxID=4795 RepID=A0A225WUT8_9STRA|nr:hypothetical protein PHMEG_0004021 [Phytophthora megakarya]